MRPVSANQQIPVPQIMRLPLFLLVFGVFSASMLIPAVFARTIDETDTARVFLYAGLLGIILFGLIGFAHAGRDPKHGALGPLMSLFCTFVILPLALAVPFYEGLQTTKFFNAYIEMIGAITTTGVVMFDDPERLDDALHLWRAQVAWMGGLVIWLAAASILAPLNLGGFEVTARAEPGRRAQTDVRLQEADVRQRLVKTGSVLIPIYVGLTGLLWLLLFISGDGAFVALCHAMSIMSTSGISPVGDVSAATSGVTGEVVMLLFMFFALSRLTFSSDTVNHGTSDISRDPEFRIGLALIVLVPAFLFLRHFLGAIDVATQDSFVDALRAIWGAGFTVMSFLTTTGFTSSQWGAAQAWSGLETPGLLLMGLAVIGGGVATTAGGVKLLRVFVLYQNGLREMERLVHPSSVSGVGRHTRRVQKDGAFIAWIFFMLFAVVLAVGTIALAATGLRFENAVIMMVAGLSTTGPLLELGGDAPTRLLELSDAAKSIFAIVMILGRLETLAIVALFTPDLWRR